MILSTGAAAFIIGFIAMVLFGVPMRHRTTLVMKCFASGMVAVSAACSTCELEGTIPS